MTNALSFTSIKKGPLMFVLIMGAFISILNQTILSVALPELMKQFEIAATTAQWLTTGFMLVNGILIPMTAYLMERYTTRQLFQSSMIFLLVGTIVCAFAPSFGMLLTGRLIQAAGAGIIMPLLMIVVLQIYPPENRGGAMGMIGMALIFAPAIGPPLAGLVMENASWRWLFYGMIPIVIVIMIVSFKYLVNVAETSRPKIDILGLILSTVGFGALLFGFSNAGSKGWTSVEVISFIVVGIIALILFVWRQLVISSPLLDLRVFKYRMYSVTTVINILVTMMMYGDLILLPLYLQTSLGYTVLESGILMLPGALIMGIMSPVAGKIYDKIGVKWLAIVGMVITIVTTLGFTNLTDSTSYEYLLIMSTLRRFGMALLLMPIATAGLNQLPARLNGHGTAISNTIRQVAGAIGTALLVTVMVTQSKNHAIEILKSGVQLTEQKLKIEAAIEGINDAYLIVAILGMAGLLISFMLTKQKAKAETQEAIKASA